MLRVLARVGLVAGAAWLLGGGASNACSVCYGNADGPMIDGARMGVWLLFGLTLVVQGGFLAFFMTLRRRARRSEPVSEPPKLGLVKE